MNRYFVFSVLKENKQVQISFAPNISSQYMIPAELSQQILMSSV